MRFVLTILMLFGLCISKAQDASLLNKLVDDLSKSCATIDYTYTARISGINNAGSGTLVSQGQMWNMVGNGVDMYCDGSALWVLDQASKEAIIEPVGDEQDTDFLTNPARMVLALLDSYTIDTVNPSSDSKAIMYSLLPKTVSNIEYLNLEIMTDSALIRKMSFAMSDGSLVKIEVSSMKLTPMVSAEAFKPQIEFDSKWIVTDLR